MPAPHTGPSLDGCAIKVHGLTKTYDGVAAVAGIDLEVQRGEVFALLGPNGAGKTTTVEILEGYRSRDGGTVSVLGLDPGTDRAALKARIGIVLQSTGVDRYLTVAETVRMFAGYYRAPRPVEEIIDLVGLTSKRNSRVTTLSGGQQRRLDVAIALAGDPELLFLDEPTTGFDPSARHEAWQVVRSLAALGKTVVLTTHYMDEAQQLADRVVVIAQGRVVAEGTPTTLGGRNLIRPTVSFLLPAGSALPAEFGAHQPPSAEGLVSFTPDDLTLALNRLTGWALANSVTLAALRIDRPSLEDIYLQLTSGPTDQVTSS